MTVWSMLGAARRRWYVAVPMLLVFLPAAAFYREPVDPEYRAAASWILLVLNEGSPDEELSGNPYADLSTDLYVSAQAVRTVLVSDAVRDQLDSEGLSDSYDVAVERGSPILRVFVTAPDRQQAVDTAERLLDIAGEELDSLQPDGGLVITPVDIGLNSTGGEALVPFTRVRLLLVMVGVVAALLSALLVDHLARAVPKVIERAGARRRGLDLEGECTEDAAEQAPIEDRRRSPKIDSVTILTFFLALLFVLPARLVVPAMGAAGRPALLLGIGLLGWWVLSWAVPSWAPRGRQPVRIALLVWAGVVVLAYLAGLNRGLPGTELSGADRGLLTVAALVGLALFAVDGIPSRRRLDTLLKRLVMAGVFLAVTGHLQFFLGFNVSPLITLPGLELNAGLIGLSERGEGDLLRVAGTSSHPIEFGVTLSMILPLAIHYALSVAGGLKRLAYWGAVAVIASAIALSISRAGIVAVAASLILLAVVWGWRARANAAFFGAIGLVAMRSAIPGLLGTIRALFTNFGNDPSIQGRQDDYPIVLGYVFKRPWFGRGVGTFLPEEYILLDNQYLMTLVTTGIVGLLALLGLFVTGYVLARRVAKSERPASTRQLGQAIAAGIGAGVVASVTFDSLAFPQFSGTLFLLLGCAGALWRLADDEAPPQSSYLEQVLKPPARRPFEKSEEAELQALP